MLSDPAGPGLLSQLQGPSWPDDPVLLCGVQQQPPAHRDAAARPSIHRDGRPARMARSPSGTVQLFLTRIRVECNKAIKNC